MAYFDYLLRSRSHWKTKMPQHNRIFTPPFTQDYYNSYFGDCELIGDDFFLSLFENNSQFCHLPGTNVVQIGSCIAGQTIFKAVKRAALRSEFATDVIINLGSVDLLKGKKIKNMKYAFELLIEELKDKAVYEPTITTLAPLANKSLSAFIESTHEKFNDYLWDSYSYVIDLHEAMLNDKNAPDFSLFATRREYSEYSDENIIKWNRLGRQRILDTISEYYDF